MANQSVVPELAVADEMDRCLAGLHAQLVMIGGDGLKNFHDCGDEIQQEYLDAMDNMVLRLQALRCRQNELRKARS